MKNIIEVRNFVKKYGDFTAVNNVSFEVEEGSIFAFLGPNGAGKSTTINTLCTIFDKTDGTLLIDGKDVSRDRDAVRSIIGVVFQESTLDNKMTVFENLNMHCYFYGIPKSEMLERIEFVLDIVDLKDWKKSMVSSLSGGMKRRVEIARSLLHYPKVLFLDEPTTGLDPQTRAHIWDYIVKLQKEKNITIFLTTHYMDEAEICSKVAIMDDGKIVAMDTPYHLKQQYTKDKAYITTSDEQGLEALLNKEEFIYKKKDGYYSIEVEKLPEFMEVLSIQKSMIKDLEIKKGTLNDVFLEITGKDIRE
ncbi:Nod factor export ATP-binding protein I [Clostridium pasteurianum DSM 525 = ATCC 6013]|uniref:Nod factor export ATP-binding protein I n=1 Tax=Clostridium pasteurianum DSM 525 = ATCC 6013 TaxID=1262449 RepID=A0A0H3J5H6_CLOPA|nr:ATP-binding cassette domain-containing protein [Clostridium pasteurianum]AJA48462.1 Nod factor export ATP-binding protein I [Clostridium pasteurianum DSM 525 = ATCC 6013]AJA52450.1 Nod factor export ATP-binding protein I [Clostridium pasteurianum DSM 525 = ATCC 6013]AOZ75704.1 ABC transporter [Clostridium pasteurianum DSM 525 = ATCC 6013]AOZ79500.1 ABC transporter [Clostridium pasteurianum]ELP60390.1 ABC transporter [Clostridium pasteurianum DSM 525 = ATCC 6013]